MMVARRKDLSLVHSTFALLPAFLEPGDLVVVNTSGTIPAALDAVAPDGTRVVVHLSTQLDNGRWVVEPRRPDGRNTQRWTGAAVPRVLDLGGGASLTLDEPYGELDPPGFRLVDRLFATLRRRGASILMATHLLDRGAAVCDLGLVLDAGRLTWAGAAADLPSAGGLDPASQPEPVR